MRDKAHRFALDSVGGFVVGLGIGIAVPGHSWRDFVAASLVILGVFAISENVRNRHG